MKIIAIQKMINWSISVGILIIGMIYSGFLMKGAGGIMYRAYCYSSPSLLSISYAKPISKGMEEKIAHALRGSFDEWKGRSFAIDPFCRMLCKKHPYIKELSARISPSRELKVEITGVDPHFIVNDFYVLSDKRRLFERELFDEELLKNLGHIIVPLEFSQKIDTATYDLFHSIPSEVYAHYIVSYSRPTYITLIPKNKDYCYRVIADATTLFDEKKRQALAKVAEDVIKRNAHEKNKQGSFVLDMRFKKGIIVKRSA